MNDPHVESLRYLLEVDAKYGRFENPPPLEHETDAYRMQLKDGVLTVEMKEHYATVESARQQISSDLNAWELDAALERDQAWLRFVYDPTGARVVDRKPSIPGHVTATGIGAIELGDVVVQGTATVEPPVFKEYPKPPAMFEPSLGVCPSIAFRKGDSNNRVACGTRSLDFARLCDE